MKCRKTHLKYLCFQRFSQKCLRTLHLGTITEHMQQNCYTLQTCPKFFIWFWGKTIHQILIWRSHWEISWHCPAHTNCIFPSSINSLKNGVRLNQTQWLEFLFSFKKHISYDYGCIQCTNFDFIMQRSFLNQTEIFGTAVSVTVAILCFHLLYSMSYMSKTYSPDQQICQSLAHQTNCFSFHSWKESFLQRPKI